MLTTTGDQVTLIVYKIFIYHLPHMFSTASFSESKFRSNQRDIILGHTSHSSAKSVRCHGCHAMNLLRIHQHSVAVLVIYIYIIHLLG